MFSPKSQLNEVPDVRARYELVSRTGPVHQPSFVMRCIINQAQFDSAPAPTKQAAEQAAAALALRYLGVDLLEATEIKATTELHQTVLVDVENVPEFAKSLKAGPPRTIRLFVSPYAHTTGHLVHRARTTLRDANDIQLIMWATREAAQLADNEELLIASRDHLFKTFVAELGHPRVRLVCNVNDL